MLSANDDYRARRNAIAGLANEHRGGPAPAVEYTPAEHGVWRQVWERLDPLHARWACREYLAASAALGLDRARIPQLRDLDPVLAAATGFHLVPVAGLVPPRTFLSRLGQGEFLATQYVRHPSAPFYTPEPDVIHELVGHAATLAVPELAALNRALGRAAAAADDATLVAIERVYWHVLEFGAVGERGRIKALGAGLLSSAGEIERLGGAARLLPWDLASMADTPYATSDYQPVLFVGVSYARVIEEILAWIEELPLGVGPGPLEGR